MKKAFIILSLLIFSCSNQTNTDNYLGVWVPDGNGNKYSKIEVEKADKNELRNDNSQPFNGMEFYYEF